MPMNFDTLTVTKDFALPARDELPETFPRGRVCRDCETILNHFNPGPRCYLHTARHETKMRAAARDN
jgi:hypothetical protein